MLVLQILLDLIIPDREYYDNRIKHAVVPDYLQKTLDVAYKSWADKGYSRDAIAAQEELTDTFQNPLKWSLIVALFYFILTAGLSFATIGSMTRKDIPSMLTRPI